jgi:hypothetical protein
MPINNPGGTPGGGGAVASVTPGVNISNSGTAADPILDHDAHTGDVTGSTALTVAADAITNAKAANMPPSTVKGNDTGGTADPKDLTTTEARALLDVYTTSEVDGLVDGTLKTPEAYDSGGSGNFPTTYGGNALQKGDSFRIVTADTYGTGTIVNPEDLLIAGQDVPGQVDANWQVVESNRDQATETVKGVAEIATQVEVDTGTDDDRIVTAAKLAGSSLASDVSTNNSKVTNANHSGDVTGATVLTIAANAVTNAKAADMAHATIKARKTAATGDPEDVLISGLTEEATPDTGDWLLGESAEGDLVKIDPSKLPVRTDKANVWTKQQNIAQGTLVDVASILWNLEDDPTAKALLAGNRALANPTNMVAGATYILIVTQDITGTRTLTYDTVYKFPGGTPPVLSVAPNAIDVLVFVSDGTNMLGNINKDFS